MSDTPDDCQDAALPRINPIAYLAGGVLCAALLLAIALTLKALFQ